jgi:hypothetical protein
MCLRKTSLSLSAVALTAALAAAPPPQSANFVPDYVAGTLVQLNDNGAWSWFMDERVIVHNGKLVVGSVRAVGDFESGQADPDWGNVEVSVYDIARGTVDRVVFHPHFEQDDHNSPTFLPMPDGRLLAAYSKHAVERKMYYRFSAPGNPLVWGPPQVVETPGTDQEFGGNNVTYTNLFPLASGRLYNFHRSFRHEPNYLYSDDGGQTWTYGGRLLRGREGYSPYLKYAFDGRETIHFIVTENHPRNWDNSIYHGYIRDGRVYHSDGTEAGPLSTSTETTLAAWDLTRVFPGDPDNVAWTIDLELDSDGHPYAAFSVQKDGRGLPPRQGGMDHRYHYARWDGSQWHQYELAYAGTRLYPFEDDYTGLVALDPHNPDVVYISTDAHPITGEPLISRADGRRHRELFQGKTTDRGRTWAWKPLTADSTADNLRPIVPKWQDPRTALVWMRGEYRNNRGEWTTAVVAMVLPR